MVIASEISQLLTNNLIDCQVPFPALEIRFLLTDSRRLGSAKDSLFFAITGPRNNGHTFLGELATRGVISFVLEEADNLPENVNFWLVKDSVLAMQQIAAFHRSKFDFPVFGITGSNGKTIVKEWFAQAATPQFMVVKSPGSYNSQIGVPLSVWQMNRRQNLGIIEAGISKTGEMARLAEVINPDYGIFTTFGPAHDEGFASKTEKLEEKLKLFAHVKKLIFNAGNAVIREYFLLHPSWKPKLYGWLILSRKSKPGGFSQILVSLESSILDIELPFSDDASIENALHVAAALRLLGWGDGLIQEKLLALRSEPMRLELKLGVGGSLLVDDSYSLDFGSLLLSLDFMAQKHRAGTEKVVILSDFQETGLSEYAIAEQVNVLLQHKEVQTLHAIGPFAEEVKSVYQIPEVYTYPNTEAFLAVASDSMVENKTVLIKGARRFTFERIVSRFSEKIHGTRLEVNLNALVHNLNYYRSIIQPSTKIMVMVKAFAYGAGSVEVAKLLEYHRIDYLAVAYADEGVQLRSAGITLPIMVMNTALDGLDKLFQYQLEPVIYSKELFTAYHLYCKNHRIKGSFHLELDTGMSRLGFSESDDEWLLSEIKKVTSKVNSVFSHLAGADSEQHSKFSYQQIRQFEQRAKNLEMAIGKPILKHILNSSGILRFPDAHFGMVRLGIGLYGVEPNNHQQDQLKSVAALITTISQVRQVPAGTTVSYGRNWVFEKEGTVATIAIGYADGFDRRLGNGNGEVIIHGTRCRVIGSVCMDMAMVDITGIDAKVGDDVIIFNETLTITEIAQKLDTIPYEVLTSVNERVKRVFFSD